MTHPATFHDLNGASVFITGGGSGVGAALTDGFLAQGANVAFIGRSDASAFVEEMRVEFAAQRMADSLKGLSQAQLSDIGLDRSEIRYYARMAR